MGDIIGGSAPSSQQVFQPSGVGAFDTSYQDLVNSSIANNPYSQYGGTASNIFNTAYNNPYAGGFQTAANNSGTALSTTGAQANAASPQINAAALSLIPATGQVLNTAFDPQRALYNRTLQQVTDQANVNNAQSGTTNSPYGASVADTANSNFNIDWQGQQLQKQIAGLGAADTGVTTAANAATSVANLGNIGAQDMLSAGQVPYDAAGTISSNQSAALQTLLSVIGNQGAGGYTSANLAALMSYLGLGATQSDTQAGLNQQAQQAADSGLGSLLGSGLSAFGNYAGLSALGSSGAGAGAAGAAGAATSVPEDLLSAFAVF